MSSKPTYQPHLNKSRELIAQANRLNQEYAELRELSLVLRKESRQLSDDPDLLRRFSISLLWGSG